MRLKRMLPTLLLAMVLSVLIAVAAAARRSELTLMLAAGLFVLQVLLALLRINAPLWRAGVRAATSDWAWDNAMLAAISYAWGGLVMLTAYPLGGLVWRHWWQYGAGMLLFAAATIACTAYLIGYREPRAGGGALHALMRVTTVQAAAVVAGLVYLVGTGKLATLKDDWAANQVFIAGGVLVLVISLVSLQTYRRQRAAERLSA
ncbi:MAG: hypothetical protein WC829_07950 [Hyphomicrobium sp.]